LKSWNALRGLRCVSSPINSKKEVEFWWGKVKLRIDELALTCDQLKAPMDAQYYPRDVRRSQE